MSEGEDLLELRLLSDVAALGEPASALRNGEVGLECCALQPPLGRSRVPLRSSCRVIAGAISASRFIWSRTVVPSCPGGSNVATSMSQPCQPATLGSAVGCSIRCTSWPCYRSFITWAAGRRYVTELADELLRRTPSFASHGWLHAACHVAHVRPRVRHKSVAAQTLIALAKAGHGIVLVPSAVRIARAGVSVAVVVQGTAWPMDSRRLGSAAILGTLCRLSGPRIRTSGAETSQAEGGVRYRLRVRCCPANPRYYTEFPSEASGHGCVLRPSAPVASIRTRPL
jgi:hypothetical protein